VKAAGLLDPNKTTKRERGTSPFFSIQNLKGCVHVKILQTVEVRQILTENSKAKLIHSLQLKKDQLNKECEQLKFECKKMEKLKKFDPTKIKQSFTNEIDIRQEKIKQLDFQIKQIHMLPLGSEIKENEIQAIVDLNVGDNWDDLMATRTIVIREGIVEEIR